MNVPEVRRKRLNEVRVQCFGGRARALARAVWKQQSYMSELLSGKRPFGEKVAREIESRLGLAAGYLDHCVESVTESDVMARIEPRIFDCKMHATAEQHLYSQMWRLGALLNAADFPERDEALELLIRALSWRGQVMNVTTKNADVGEVGQNGI